MTMQRSIYIAISLDGFIARTDGAIDWLAIVEREGEDYGWQAFFDSVDTLVMGRKTWETALSFPSWPYTNKRCVILSKDTARAAPHGEEFFAGDLAVLLDRLAAEGARRVYFDGGTIVGQALRDNVVDDVTLSLIPVLLGTGTPLAPGLTSDRRLHLTGHQVFASGLVQLRYATRS